MEATKNVGDGLIDACGAQQEGIDAQNRENLQRVDIAELLITMKNAIEKMSVHNTHRGVMTTAGSLIIHLVTENARLLALLDAAIPAEEGLTASPKSLVQLA